MPYQIFAENTNSANTQAKQATNVWVRQANTVMLSTGVRVFACVLVATSCAAFGSTSHFPHPTISSQHHLRRGRPYNVNLLTLTRRSMCSPFDASPSGRFAAAF